MNLTIVCIGKLKENYWQDAVAEYAKRLQAYCRLNIVELKEERLPDNAGAAEEQQVIEAEGRAILKAVPDNSYLVALDIWGQQVSSEQLSAKLDKLALDGKSQITMVIGGSLGLSSAVIRRADWRLSCSALTFPHQMMRVILLEQLYRAFKISRNETYHK